MPVNLGPAMTSERQELMAMVKKCLEIVAVQQAEFQELKLRMDRLEERVSMAAGQYRQRVME